MKKLSLIIAIVFITMSVQAQNNVVKLGLSNIFTGGINLEYEYVLSERSSVLGELGIQIPLAVPQSIFDRVESIGANNNLEFREGTYGGVYVAGEYRFYTSGNAPQGFYVAPYVKLGNRSFQLTGSYTNDNTGNSVDASAELNVFTINLGGQIGYQFVVQDKFTISWNIIGLGLGLNRPKGTFRANDNGVFNDFAADTQAFIDDIPILNNIDLVPDEISKEISAGGGFIPFVGTRASLSIGYIF
ncbi:MAG: hypothetical protein ACJAUH_000358 [Saprospiraceae bacterium]|jgi:hypothetical protein